MKNKVKALLGLIHLSIPIVLTGCSTENSNNTDTSTSSEPSYVKEQDNEDNATESDEATIQENDSDDEDDTPALAGTCPHGRHCSAPGKCDLFTDNNDNDLCDRGEG